MGRFEKGAGREREVRGGEGSGGEGRHEEQRRTFSLVKDRNCSAVKMYEGHLRGHVCST